MPDVKWLPLESNPAVLNHLLQQFGVSGEWGVTDIVSFDEEILNGIPKPVLAVLFLFPYTKNYKKYRRELDDLSQEAISCTGSDVFFMRQTIKNSCGTVAVIHAIANNMNNLDFNNESIVQKFIETSVSLTPDEKAHELENNAEIKEAHQASALLGNSEISESDSSISLDDEPARVSVTSDRKTDHHYITLVNVGSNIYELDGYKNHPLYRGVTSEDSFFRDATRICAEYMERDPSNLRFTALAFCAVQPTE